MRDMSNKSAKARFADGTDSFLTIKGVRYRIAGMRKDAKGNLVYDLHGTSKTAHPVTYTLVKFLDDQRWVLWGAQGQEVARGKMEASRPGAKAKMGKYRAFVYRGSPRSNVLVKATEWMDSATEAENAAKQIAASYRDKPGFNSGDYFADIAQETPEGAKTIKNNVRFSRPGAKDTMAAFEGSYAEIRVRYEFPDGTTDMETMSGPARSAAASAIRRITAKGNGAKAWVIGMRPADPRGRFPAGQVEIWKGEVVDGRAYERGGSFSRPGAKARFGTNKRVIRARGHEFLAEDEGKMTRISIKIDGHWEHAATVNTDNQTATEWIEANAQSGNPMRWLPSAFSRPGAKARFASIDAGMMDGAGNEVVIRMADGSRATARYNRGTGKWSLEGHADVPAFSKVRDLVEHLTKQGMARPGDKSKFSNGARNRAFLSKIDAATRSKILTSIAKHYGISASEAMAEVTDADAESLLDYMVEPERSATSVLLKRHGFSRPGAKAKMAKWTVTPTQKHGKDIEEHTAKIGRDHWKIDSMPHLGKSVGSLYRWDEMRGLRHISTGNIEQLKRQAEAISTKQDALSDVMRGFSRPGAKVTAGRAEDLYRQLSSGSITYANAKQWERLVTEALRLPDYTPPGGDMSLHEIAEDLGGDLMALKTHSGPVPNAKAKAEKATMAAHPENIAWMRSLPAPVVAKVREILTKPHSGARAKALRDALKSGGVSYNKWIPDASAGAEVLGHQFQEAFAKPSDLEREDVKAGLKLMEKADKAVSDKIRTLIAEGKPQDQAVAIALDMKRRGEI